MRATRAEPRGALRQIGGIATARDRIDMGQACADTVGAAPLFDQDLAKFQCDIDGVEGEMLREKHLSACPFAVAKNPPPAPVVENRFLDLAFDQLALFLDHHDQVQPLGPIGKALHIKRPCLADLVGGHTQFFGRCRIDAQCRKRGHQVEPILARGNKADLGPRFAMHALIHAIGPRKGHGGVSLMGEKTFFLRDPMIIQTDIQPTLGHGEIRQDKLHPIRAAIDDGCGLDRVFHRLEADPKPGKTAQRKTICAIVEDFLHTRGADHRHTGIDHRPIGLVAHGRAFARVIIAHGHDHAPMARGSGHIDMAHHIARAVHPRPLAIP